MESNSNKKEMDEGDYINDEQVYNEFMSSLTPCSSNNTFNEDPITFDPVEYNNLLSERNELNKTGTLTDELYLEKFEPSMTQISIPPNLAGQTSSEDQQGLNSRSNSTSTAVERETLVKIMVVNNEQDNFNINLFALLDHINSLGYKKSLNDLTINNLIIYISKRMNLAVENIKLLHLGKIYNVTSSISLKTKHYLLPDMKLDSFPTIQLIKLNNSSLLNYNEQRLYEISFETDDHYNVTYADAIVHKMKTMKKSRFRNRFKKLLKVSV
ncbi:hypothetical protein CLIB1444_08S02036 [[Candida] jaroonii]|uniref:Uncharacterized protein n=1 Tax=[Candida] jaroonii TaxID=467808 RepID=A0ACA9YBX7_9ASCO|nr:hypothetical protein CLIB1444_08S02036 [[Candida] jaroonii]